MSTHSEPNQSKPTHSPDGEAAKPRPIRSLRAHWTPVAYAYLVLSAVGLVGTWTYNVIAILERRDYLGDWVGSGAAVSSLTVDLLIAALAGSVFILVEARRLGMKRGWLYIVLSGVTAFACMFPLFLCMRERTLQARREVRGGDEISAGTRTA